MNEVKLNTASLLTSIVNSYVPGYASNIILHENQWSALEFFSVGGYRQYIECKFIKGKDETELRFKFTIKNSKNGEYHFWIEQPNFTKYNLSDVVNKIRKTIRFQDWPQNLVDKMFKTQIDNKNTSTKEGIANFIKVCGDAVAFPSEHAQTSDEVLPDITKATEDKPNKDDMQNKPVCDSFADDTKAVQAQLICANRSLDERITERAKLLKEMRDDSNSQSLSVPRTSDNKADHGVTATDQVSLDNLSILDKIKLTVSPGCSRNEHYDAFESADHFIVFNMKKNKMFISPKTLENRLRYHVYSITTNWDKKDLLSMIDASTKVYKEKLKLSKYKVA